MSLDDPKPFLAAFDAIVLVANSPSAAVALREGGFPQRTLFVFFNRVFNVLDHPFAEDSLLVSRATPSGSSLVYKDELDRSLDRLRPGRFHGLLVLKVAENEVINPREDFGSVPMVPLDLTERFSAIYPRGRIPSSGFAIALWLAEMRLGKPIRLVGFSGVREGTARVLDVHDWTWEQVVLDLCYRKDLLSPPADQTPWPAEGLLDRFPEFSAADFDAVAAGVLARRLGATDRAVDQLFKAVKPQIRLLELLRGFKPQSRKSRARQKLLDRLGRNEG
ncbi:hypothetical protein SAMN05428963_10687 [Consotaella salsifontis]|uniref:Uncharacterized protein n=1 Tax=Consotaella salsifontis TaxID=1365950 RepID=A0A1T4R7M5_9HYPH|nr:hypothetical protein SAMN05428963_10687 [Consotaella salsifontis]